MGYIVSSLMLRYLGAHTTDLSTAIKTFEKVPDAVNRLQSTPFLCELSSPPTFEELQNLASSPGRYFIFYEHSGRCFIMHDMQDRDMHGFDPSKLAEMADWEPKPSFSAKCL